MRVCRGRGEQHEGPTSLGERLGEQHGDEGSVVEPDHDCLLRTRRVEDGDGVLHLRLEIREPIERNGVRQAGAPPVEVDQSTERAEASQEPGEIRQVPDCLNVMDPGIDKEQIDVTGANRLVGEMDLAVPCEVGFGHHRRNPRVRRHRRQVAAYGGRYEQHRHLSSLRFRSRGAYRVGERPAMGMQGSRRDVVGDASSAGDAGLHDAARGAIVGLWRLVSYEDREDDARPWTQSDDGQPSGLALYHPSGMLSVQLFANPGSDSIAYHVGYIGTFSVREARPDGDGFSGVVEHRMQSASDLELLALDVARQFSVSADRLMLSDGRRTWRRTFERIL